jgi:signal transduction histidine kinase
LISFKDLAIRHQLIIMIFMISLFSVLLALSIFIGFERQVQRQDAFHNISVVARITAERAQFSVAEKDSYTMSHLLESLGNSASIVSACFHGKHFEPVVNHYRSDSPSWARDDRFCIEAAENLSGVHLYREGYYTVNFPVLLEGINKVGELIILFDISSVNKRLKVLIVVMVLIIILVSFVSIVLSSRIQSLISKPLADLIDAAEKVRLQSDFSIRVPRDRDDELGQLVSSFNSMLDTIDEQSQALMAINESLESEIDNRTSELSHINSELEAFTYSVSHDLRSPLRSISGFSSALLEDHVDELSADTRDYLQRISDSSERMGSLIDSLLYLSRVSRQEIEIRPCDLSDIAREQYGLVCQLDESRKINFRCPESLLVFGDRQLLEIMMYNLIVNAWKYTSKTASPEIEVGAVERDGNKVFYVRDNGDGFDMKYSDRLFTPFARLHREEEFSGLGIGLATVARIVHRHHGEIWAEALPGEGATFFFKFGKFVE